MACRASFNFHSLQGLETKAEFKQKWSSVAGIKEKLGWGVGTMVSASGCS